jgi:hypothetical protein
MKTRTVYGMAAIGPLAYFSGKGRIDSRLLYTSLEALEKDREAFKTRALEGGNPLTSLQTVTDIQVIEYELVED